MGELNYVDVITSENKILFIYLFIYSLLFWKKWQRKSRSKLPTPLYKMMVKCDTLAQPILHNKTKTKIYQNYLHRGSFWL